LWNDGVARLGIRVSGYSGRRDLLDFVKGGRVAHVGCNRAVLW
jgi:hypothetical protein